MFGGLVQFWRMGWGIVDMNPRVAAACWHLAPGEGLWLWGSRIFPPHWQLVASGRRRIVHAFVGLEAQLQCTADSLTQLSYLSRLPTRFQTRENQGGWTNEFQAIAISGLVG